MTRDPRELLLLTIAAYSRLGRVDKVEQLWSEYDSKYEYPKDVKTQWLFERLGYIKNQWLFERIGYKQRVKVQSN